MAKQVIDVGQTAGDGEGDPLREVFQKTNSNFDELYSFVYTDEDARDAVANALVAGTNIFINKDDANDTITINSSASGISTEEAQDIVGAMFSGNSETRIQAVYDDPSGKLNLTVDGDLNNFDNSVSQFISDYTVTETDVTQHQQALSITESQISDLGSYIEGITNEQLENLSNVTITSASSGQVLKFNGTNWINDTDETSSGGSGSLTQEEVEDFVGGMVSGNTETLISVTYDDTNGKVNFVVDNDLSNYDNSTSGFITDYTVTELDVTQHQDALSLTQSQVQNLESDLSNKTNFPTTATGNQISFATEQVYNFGSPASGNITQDLTNAEQITQKIYHNDSTEPSVPSEWVSMGGEYVVDETNIIFANYVSDTRVEYWIVQEADVLDANTAEEVRDIISASLVEGTNITIDKDDVNDTFTINSSLQNGVVNILDFGAVADDNTVDNATAIMDAFNSLDYAGSHIVIPDGDYYFSSDIIIPALRNATVDFRGKLISTNASKVVFEYFRNSNISGFHLNNEATDYSDETIIGLEIRGLDKCTFSPRMIRGFTTNLWFNPQEHPDPAIADGKHEPIAYNIISGGTFWYSKYNMRVTLADDSIGGYFNENTFIGCDIRQAGTVPDPNWGIFLEQDPDSFNVNNNRFYGVTFENLNTAMEGDTNFTVLSGCRFENTDIIYRGYLSRSQIIGGVFAMDYDKYRLTGLSRHNSFIGSQDRLGNTEQVFSADVGGISYFDPITLQKEGHIGYDSLTTNFVLDSVGNQSQIMNKQYQQSFNDSDSYYDQIKDGSYREGSFIWNVSPDTRNVLGVIITRSGTHLSGLESLTSKYGQAVTVSGNTGDGFVTLDDPSILDDLQSTVPPFANGCHLDISGVSSHVEIDTITPDGVISFFSDTVNSDFTGNEVDFYQIRFNQALFELNIIEDSGTQIEFDRKRIYNTPSSPASGSITQNLTGALLGVQQKIYHNDSTAPTFPLEWTLIGNGTYQTGTLNIIYAEYVDDTRIEYQIKQ